MRCPWLVFALLALSTASAGASTGYCESRRGSLAEVTAIAMLLCVLALIGYTARHFRQVRAARFAIPVPISLLVAERVARAVQRSAGVIATVGIVGVPTLVIMNISSLSILSTIIGCIGLRGFFIARTMLQLIERAPVARAGAPGAARTTAEVDGHTMIVRSGDEEASLDVSPRALAAARRHAVPTSIAKR